jgi:hypothetical protein
MTLAEENIQFYSKKQQRWAICSNAMPPTAQASNDRDLGINNGDITTDSSQHPYAELFALTEQNTSTLQNFTRNLQETSSISLKARHQIMKMMQRAAHPPNSAVEVLSGLDYIQKVLISCTATFKKQNFPTLADFFKSEDWTKEEIDGFCTEFATFVSERNTKRHILQRWERLRKIDY